MKFDAQDWLRAEAQNTSLDELRQYYPALWTEVSEDVLKAIARKDPETIIRLMSESKAKANFWAQRARSSSQNPQVLNTALPFLLRDKMVFLALDKFYKALLAQTDSHSGKLSAKNRALEKILFYNQIGESKAVSLTWYKTLWPLVTQKGGVIAEAKKRGFYGFYAKPFLKHLKQIIGTQSCLEIGAGNGTLSRLLTELGVKVRATDDHSWHSRIAYPTFVEKMDAATAVQHYQPEVVLCSWPPPKNTFEKKVLLFDSVKSYIMIGSRHRYASGDWDFYEEQKKFYFEIDTTLTQMVLPAEIENIVVVFSRPAR